MSTAQIARAGRRMCAPRPRNSSPEMPRRGGCWPRPRRWTACSSSAPVPALAVEAALAERIVAAAQRSPRIVKLEDCPARRSRRHPRPGGGRAGGCDGEPASAAAPGQGSPRRRASCRLPGDRRRARQFRADAADSARACRHGRLGVRSAAAWSRSPFPTRSRNDRGGDGHDEHAPRPLDDAGPGRLAGAQPDRDRRHRLAALARSRRVPLGGSWAGAWCRMSSAMP